MRPISDAVVLMAGTGSRLRASGEMLPKPLILVDVRIISYIIDALQKVEITKSSRRGRRKGDALLEALRRSFRRRFA